MVCLIGYDKTFQADVGCMTFSDIFLAESDGPFNGFTHLHGQQIVFRHTLICRPCVEVLVRRPFRRRFPRNSAFASWIGSRHPEEN